MIEVKNLTKKYGDEKAVDNLSFTVEKGRIYGFLGPNGAGKSTTMNIITGYIASTEGEVIINGHDILKEPKEAKACIGYLPEIPPLYTDMTADEYLDFAAELKGIAKSERKAAVDEVKEILQIGDVSGRLIKNLSKGYKQRVGFAQALLGMPEILILDEPTVGLDPLQIIEIRELIKKLGETHTIILSSHILSEVSAICDHVMIISKGKLVASDTTENLMKDSSLEEVFLELTALDPASMEKMANAAKSAENAENIDGEAPAADAENADAVQAGSERPDATSEDAEDATGATAEAADTSIANYVAGAADDATATANTDIAAADDAADAAHTDTTAAGSTTDGSATADVPDSDATDPADADARKEGEGHESDI